MSIVKRDGKFFVVSKKGKKLSKALSSAKAAAKRLAQVERAKHAKRGS